MLQKLHVYINTYIYIDIYISHMFVLYHQCGLPDVGTLNGMILLNGGATCLFPSPLETFFVPGAYTQIFFKRKRSKHYPNAIRFSRILRGLPGDHEGWH